MEVYVGKVVNTHGLKGELRILSTFSNKEVLFKLHNKLYIDGNAYLIVSYRKHKNYDMVLFEGLNSIDDVLSLKGKDVYVKRSDLPNILLDEDLIGYEVIQNGTVKGIVKGIENTKVYPYLIVEGKKEFLVPKVDALVSNIDVDNKKIYLSEIEGLIDED